VLRRTEAGFDLVEVKASTSVKKEEHLPDAAFQVLLLERTGLPVERAHIGYVNNQFVLARPGDYQGLLVESDVTTPVRELLPRISERAVEFIGSWSLKDVAPTADATLAYETLAGVQEGETAQLAFVELRDGTPDPARREELRRQLKTYCARDTYALVLLRRFLCGPG
jgi:hypothetical protein